MSTNTSQPNGQTWEGKSVALADIEREMSRLWHTTTSTAQDRQMPVRSSVLNLVVHTRSDTDAEQINETVARLSGRHPLRAIIVSAEPHHPEPSLDTSINTYCYDDPATGSRLCCEQVIVGANGDVANHLTGVVLPLLIPDLPVYLWWMGEPEYESEIFTSLMRSTQKLIIDSRSFPPSPATFRQVLDLSRGAGQICAVTDLNWVRLWPWFEVVAQFFDDRSLQPHLYGIRNVVVQYAKGDNDRDPNPAQAALFAGWLFSRLHEKPSQAQLEPVSAPHVDCGNVVSFRLETQHCDQTASFQVGHLEESATHARACADVGGRQSFERVVVTKQRTHAEMLDVSLETCERDLPYEESLQLAIDLLRKAQAR